MAILSTSICLIFNIFYRILKRIDYLRKRIDYLRISPEYVI